MRIVHLARHLVPAGGVESYVRGLCELLGSAGHELLVLGGDRASLDWAQLPVQTATLPGYHLFGAPGRASDKALQLISEFSPDVIHVHEMNNTELTGRLARTFPVLKHVHIDQSCAAGGPRFFRRARRACSRKLGPLCLWHYYAAPCGPGRDPFFALRSYRQSRAEVSIWSQVHLLVANSRFTADSCVRAGAPEESVRVLHYFVSSAEAAHSPTSAPELLFVGRIMPEKGLDDLIRALSRLGGAARLTVVGDGPARNRAEKLAAELGLRQRVVFAGWQTDMASFYQRSALLVVPSLWPEPFGIVGIEAMARALPVVAYRSGGIPEWLDDSRTGIAVEPGRIDELAGAIGELLSDRGKAARMGLAGQHLQRQRFSPQPHLAAIEDLYREVADRQARSPLRP